MGSLAAVAGRWARLLAEAGRRVREDRGAMEVAVAGVVAALIFLPAGAVSGATAEASDEDLGSFRSLLWDSSFSLRGWSGYNDNPRLSAVNPEGSALVAAGGDFLALRLPVDGLEVTVQAMIEHVQYLESGFDPETIALASGRVVREWESGWGVGLAAEYFFLKQVFDASEIVGVPVILPTEGHTMTYRPVVSRELGAHWRLELEPEASRQWLAAPLDGFWDLGPRLVARRELGQRSEAGGSYRFRQRLFDERSPRTADGGALSGTLEYSQHEVEGFWRHAWGAGSRWRTSLRAGYLDSSDNGGGFYDYRRGQVAASVRYVAPRWEARVDGRARWYLYPVQAAGFVDDAKRRRNELGATVRGEWKLSSTLRFFAQYECEVSDENVTAADYRVNSVWGGVEYDL